MRNNFFTGGRKWSSVEVKVDEKGGVGGKRRLNAQRSEQIDCQSGLWKEAIPFS
jgi:hypothetical protein